MTVPGSYLPQREVYVWPFSAKSILCGRQYTDLANSKDFKVETSLSAYVLSMPEDCVPAEYVPRAVYNVTSQPGTPIVKTIKVPYSENRFPEAHLHYRRRWKWSYQVTVWRHMSREKTFSSSKIAIIFDVGRYSLHLGRKYYTISISTTSAYIQAYRHQNITQ